MVGRALIMIVAAAIIAVSAASASAALLAPNSAALARCLVVAFIAADKSQAVQIPIYIDGATGLAVLDVRALRAILESHEQLSRENERLKAERCL